MHRAEARHVIAAEFVRAPRKSLGGAKAQKLLQRRIEIGLPPDQKIETLDDQRRKSLPKLTRHGLDAEPYIGPSIGDGHSEVHLGPLDRLDAMKILFPQSVAFEQLGQHPFAARFFLARLKPQSARGAQRTDRASKIGAEDQAARALRPFDQDDGFVAESLADRRDVPAVFLGLRDMQSGRDKVLSRAALERVKRAIQKSRDAGARFAQRPFEKRIVAPDDDGGRGRRRPFASRGGIGLAAVRGDPRRDFIAREQKLARDAAHRQRPLRRQFINFALFDAEQGRQFARRQEIHHAFSSVFPGLFGKIA